MPTQDLSISSRLLRAASYDAEAQELTLTFKAGAKWKYSGVPQEEFDNFAGASSQGSYFLNHIRGAYAEKRA